MKTLERANRRVIITVNGEDKTAEYRFKCTECKHMDNCPNMSECKHVKYLADHSPVVVKSNSLDKDNHTAAVVVGDAATFAKMRTVIERNHRKRRYPYVVLNVKVK